MDFLKLLLDNLIQIGKFSYRIKYFANLQKDLILDFLKFLLENIIQILWTLFEALFDKSIEKSHFGITEIPLREFNSNSKENLLLDFLKFLLKNFIQIKKIFTELFDKPTRESPFRFLEILLGDLDYNLKENLLLNFLKFLLENIIQILWR